MQPRSYYRNRITGADREQHYPTFTIFMTTLVVLRPIAGAYDDTYLQGVLGRQLGGSISSLYCRNELKRGLDKAFIQLPLERSNDTNVYYE